VKLCRAEFRGRGSAKPAEVLQWCNPDYKEWVSVARKAAQILQMQTLPRPTENRPRAYGTAGGENPSADTSQLSAAKKSLIAHLRNGDRAAPATTKIPRCAGLQMGPLSSNQEQSWFFSQLQPRSALYNVPVAIRLCGNLDITALQKAVEEIVERHQVLRTSFGGEFQPSQVVRVSVPVQVAVTDLREVHPQLREAELQCLVEEEIRQPFDLVRDLMIRVRAFRMAEDDWALTFVIHHIAGDFWSWRVLCRELMALYQSAVDGRQSSLADLPIQYRDFARWQQEWLQGPQCENQVSYWRTNLAGSPAVLALPFARPRLQVQSFHGACEVMAVPTELHEQLIELSRREETTLFMTLLAAFVALLGRYTKSEDIIVGSPAAGRCHAELEELIGFFANIMVLRTSLKGDPTFRELLRRTREIVLDGLAHQEVPFAKLVQELRPPRSANHLPIFQIVFMLQQEFAASFRLPGVTATDIEVDTGTAKFDLMLTVMEREQGLRCCAEYNTSLFDKADIRRMLLEYQRFLQTLVDRPEVRVSEFKLPNRLGPL
jgi:hypothetical protein